MDEGWDIAARNLVARAKALILTPKDEWPKIASETLPNAGIFKHYALPLAALGPIAGFIGGQVFGSSGLIFPHRPSLTSGITAAVTGFVASLVGLLVITLLAEFLAPKFGGEANRTQAFKLAAYGYTAAWAAGIFNLIPALGFFGLLGLYSIYLIYLGAMPLMKVPADKAIGYTAAVILIAFVFTLILSPITALITGTVGLLT